jgi:hypothetical protein
MNREEELTDILRKVEWGQLDSTVAFDRISRLCSVVGRSEQLTAFNEWLDDNHHSFKIPDMILQDYIRWGG